MKDAELAKLQEPYPSSRPSFIAPAGAAGRRWAEPRRGARGGAERAARGLRTMLVHGARASLAERCIFRFACATHRNTVGNAAAAVPVHRARASCAEGAVRGRRAACANAHSASRCVRERLGGRRTQGPGASVWRHAPRSVHGGILRRLRAHRNPSRPEFPHALRSPSASFGISASRMRNGHTSRSLRKRARARCETRTPRGGRNRLHSPCGQSLAEDLQSSRRELWSLAENFSRRERANSNPRGQLARRAPAHGTQT